MMVLLRPIIDLNNKRYLGGKKQIPDSMTAPPVCLLFCYFRRVMMFYVVEFSNISKLTKQLACFLLIHLGIWCALNSSSLAL
jgi:hypothetical protein